MSYSTTNEKYRKYTDMLRKDPQNSVLRHKVQKYGAQLQKSAQKGGNGSSNPFADILSTDPTKQKQPQPQSVHGSIATNPMGPRAKTSTSTQRSGKTEDLVGKIQSMLEYAKQHGATMEGGARNRSGKSKTHVKGHREMTGGNPIDFAQISESGQLPEDLEQETQKNLDTIVARQGALSAAIIHGVSGFQENISALTQTNQQLVIDKSAVDAQLAAVITEKEAVKASLASVTAEKDTAEENLQSIRTEKTSLTQAKARLEAEVAQLKASTDKTEVTSLLSEARNQISALEQREASLKEKIVAFEAREILYNQKIAEHDATITELTAKLRKTTAGAEIAVKQLLLKNKNLVEMYNKKTKELEEALQGKIKLTVPLATPLISAPGTVTGAEPASVAGQDTGVAPGPEADAGTELASVAGQDTGASQGTETGEKIDQEKIRQQVAEKRDALKDARTSSREKISK